MNTENPKRRQDLEHMGHLIDGVIADLGGRESLGTTALLWAEWADVAGRDWALTTPIRLDNGRLVVAVPDGITATRLRYVTGELIARIDARIGPDVVSSIRVQIRPEGRRR